MKAIRLTLTSLFLIIGSVASASAVEPGCNPPVNPDNLFGKVLREDSKRPLQNVTVTAILLNKKEKYALTDTDGEFGIVELKPGTYKIIFEKDGYRKVVRDKVNVKLNEPIELNVEMEFLNYNLVPSPFFFFLVDNP